MRGLLARQLAQLRGLERELSAVPKRGHRCRLQRMRAQLHQLGRSRSDACPECHAWAAGGP